MGGGGFNKKITMSKKNLSQTVIERLLLSKDLLSRIRFSSIAQSDGHTLSAHVLTAHDAAEFCIRTFLNVALRIQDAELTPSPTEFYLLYRHKITALKDGVEIWQEQRDKLLQPIGRNH